MSDAEIMELVKLDLGMSASAYNKLVEARIKSAKAAIKNEGINLIEGDDEDSLLIADYAAFLHRDRKSKEGMPRSLRWRLNNRLLSKKNRKTEAGETNG
ncbi:MAG: hypothetical protein IJP13_08625 [Lachnospiraceae bacterium]|nr:hypothetical protein [Lachnospiraceae bacterium]